MNSSFGPTRSGHASKAASGGGGNQGRIKRIQLRSNDGSILCFSRIVLVVVLVLVIGLFARVFDYDYDDEDDDDSRTAPSTRPGTLVALAKSSLMPGRRGRLSLP